ncbi:MAG: hypothetical protein JWN69_2488 [Alphaproteobacteria bacterium]|nr:hypothetical protein [Alphaproteobacteria bacterium]
MVALPPVDEIFWERVAREFDDAGPEACMADILDELLTHNPLYLEMATRYARDCHNPDRVLTGFAMFYRIIALASRDRGRTVPRITNDTRDAITTLIGEFGEERFTLLATETLHGENPYLLQMADSFASPSDNHLIIMQGFVLLYKALSAQAVIDGLRITAAKRSSPPKRLSPPKS